jgi:hypothetical protein
MNLLKEPYFCLTVAPGFCLRIGLTAGGRGYWQRVWGASVTPTLSSNIQNSSKKAEKYEKIGRRKVGGSRKNCFVNK